MPVQVDSMPYPLSDPKGSLLASMPPKTFERVFPGTLRKQLYLLEIFLPVL
jgi:hypothetical protein